MLASIIAGAMKSGDKFKKHLEELASKTGRALYDRIRTQASLTAAVYVLFLDLDLIGGLAGINEADAQTWNAFRKTFETL